MPRGNPESDACRETSECLPLARLPGQWSAPVLAYGRALTPWSGGAAILSRAAVERVQARRVPGSYHAAGHYTHNWSRPYRSPDAGRLPDTRPGCAARCATSAQRQSRRVIHKVCNLGKNRSRRVSKVDCIRVRRRDDVCRCTCGDFRRDRPPPAATNSRGAGITRGTSCEEPSSKRAPPDIKMCARDMLRNSCISGSSVA